MGVLVPIHPYLLGRVHNPSNKGIKKVKHFVGVKSVEKNIVENKTII